MSVALLAIGELSSKEGLCDCRFMRQKKVACPSVMKVSRPIFSDLGLGLEHIFVVLVSYGQNWSRDRLVF